NRLLGIGSVENERLHPNRAFVGHQVNPLTLDPDLWEGGEIVVTLKLPGFGRQPGQGGEEAGVVNGTDGGARVERIHLKLPSRVASRHRSASRSVPTASANAVAYLGSTRSRPVVQT